MKMVRRVSARLLWLFCCAAILFARTSSAQSIHLPPHEKVVLKNGLTVLLLEKHGVPIVSFRAVIKAGSAADPMGQEGLAAVTAALLRKGTKTRSAQQFAAELDFIGASFEADANADSSSVSAECLSKDVAQGLALLSDALVHPTFAKDEVDKLLAQALDGVKAAKDDPNQVLGTYFYAYLFGPKGYGRPEDGDERSLPRIQREAIAKFYETHYAPGNVILAVAGDFKTEEMKKRVDAAFGAWPAKQSPALKTDPVAPAKGRRLLLVDKPDATQTYFAIGNVGIAATDRDRVAIRVVNTVFGERFTSMLNEALRVESGLTYGATAFFDGRKEPGAFLMQSFTKNESTVQAIDVALEVLDKLHENGITAEQLASAKNYIKGQFPPTMETSGALARRISTYEFYGLDDNEVNQLAARIDAVTLETAKQVIAKHYPRESLVFTLIGKASEIGPAVKKYGSTQDLRKIDEPGFGPEGKAGTSSEH
jgi:predicted Zn-dependent peptidase